MTEARRLLERIDAARRQCGGHCDYQAKIGSACEHMDEILAVIVDIPAYLAMTTYEGLMAEEQELLEWHSPKAGWWMGEKRDDLCQGCSKRPIEGCVTRKVIFSLAESRAREGELVAALEDARLLCKNDHAYDNKNSQVFEAVQVMNRALGEKE